MNKAEFEEKRKKLLEQRVRPTEGTEAVSAWDYDFNDSNEVLQSGEVELLENMTSIVPEDRPKTGEIFKEKRNKTRHKLDERSGALDMNLISQKLDEWQRASKNDVDRELINSCVAQITPLTNEEFRWALDFQMSEVRARNAAAYTMDGFVEMARFSISFEEAKAFKASRNQGIRKNEWQDLTVVVGIWSKTQK